MPKFVVPSERWLKGKNILRRQFEQSTLSAATITLALDSARFQLHTLIGAQDIVMPEATSVQMRGVAFLIHNNDTGDILTVKQSDGTTTVVAIPVSSSRYIVSDGNLWQFLL